MTDKEWKFLESQEFESIFEWGTGGSTFAFANRGKRIVTVDSSKEWIRKVQDACGEFPVTFVFVDLGPTREWGFPVSNVSGEPYVKAFQPQEAVLIDGRFRVACGLYARLHSPDTCRVFIHDFTNRPHYHELLRFYEIVNTVETLVELRAKPSNLETIPKLLDKYFFDAR